MAQAHPNCPDLLRWGRIRRRRTPARRAAAMLASESEYPDRPSVAVVDAGTDDGGHGGTMRVDCRVVGSRATLSLSLR
jgi:hypothetical protein